MKWIWLLLSLALVGLIATLGVGLFAGIAKAA